MAETTSSNHTNLMGRNTEIALLMNDLNNGKSVRFVTGESGIGKTSLLDGLYGKLRDNPKFFVGYYSRPKALVSESQSITYPINIALSSVIEDIKRSETRSEKMKNATKRLRNALISFSKDSGKKLAEAIVEDVFKKAGFDRATAF